MAPIYPAGTAAQPDARRIPARICRWRALQWPSPAQISGGLGEWFNPTVLKTVDGKPSVSSNLTASAIFFTSAPSAISALAPIGSKASIARPGDGGNSVPPPEPFMKALRA